jgi:hypothetical protein
MPNRVGQIQVQHGGPGLLAARSRFSSYSLFNDGRVIEMLVEVQHLASTDGHLVMHQHQTKILKFDPVLLAHVLCDLLCLFCGIFVPFDDHFHPLRDPRSQYPRANHASFGIQP